MRRLHRPSHEAELSRQPLDQRAIVAPVSPPMNPQSTGTAPISPAIRATQTPWPAGCTWIRPPSRPLDRQREHRVRPEYRDLSSTLPCRGLDVGVCSGRLGHRLWPSLRAAPAEPPVERAGGRSSAPSTERSLPTQIRHWGKVRPGCDGRIEAPPCSAVRPLRIAERTAFCPDRARLPAAKPGRLSSSSGVLEAVPVARGPPGEILSRRCRRRMPEESAGPTRSGTSRVRQR